MPMTRKKTVRKARIPLSNAEQRPRRRRAETKEAIRTEIVGAALNLFQTKGFEATTTKSIARKAGIAEGTVFNYFKSKEDIALYFFEQEVDHAMAAVRDNPRLRKAPLRSEERRVGKEWSSRWWRETYKNT